MAESTKNKKSSANVASNFNVAINVKQLPSLRPSSIVGYFKDLFLQVLKFAYYLVYYAVQTVIIAVFKPRPPPKRENPQYRGRIAIIGGGLTGISTAAHCVAHGFDVVIYEENDSVGGIWSHVNSTSGLQLNSMLYRFFPGVHWSKAFPHRDEILSQIHSIWQEYGLESRTRLNTKVTTVHREPRFSTDPKESGHGRWVVNNGEDGIFDAVFATIGSCGEKKTVGFKDQDKYSKGRIVHSSELDQLKPEEIKGHKIVIVGSGASGVEAAELAVSKGADDIKIIARDDKWIIPRNIVFDTLLSAQPFGRETPLSWIPEGLLRRFHYRDLKCLTPPKKTPFYSGTPIVNDEFLENIRKGKITYIRGDTEAFTEEGVSVNVRGIITVQHPNHRVPKLVTKTLVSESDHDSEHAQSNGSTRKNPLTNGSFEHLLGEETEIDKGEGGRFTKSGTPGSKQTIPADIVVLATGFNQPSVDFLPEDLWPDRYSRPNLYLQVFSTEDWSVVLTNASYKNAVGTVGHFHIGIYARILMMFIMDKNCRPLPEDLKLWVDVIRFIKRGSPGGALSFFTYMELTIWVLTFLFFRPERLRWTPFILFGWGTY